MQIILRSSFSSSTTTSSDIYFMAGEVAAGDFGAGALYTSVGASSSGTRHIQDFNSTWFNLVTSGTEICAGWFGVKADGTTDDSAALALALSFGAGKIVRLPKGDCLIASGQTISGVNNMTVTGPGRIKLSSSNNNGSYYALQFSSCDNLVWEADVVGTLNSQQYSVAVTGTQVSTSFNSGSWMITNLEDNTSQSTNVSASKSGNIVSVALTGDAGAYMSRAVTGSAITLTSGSRYVIFADEGFQAGGHNLGAPRFYNASGTEYMPGQGLAGTNFDYLTGTASIKVKVGTGRFYHTTTLSAIPGYVGAQYDVSKLSILKLENEFNSINFSTFSIAQPIIFSACNDLTVRNSTFSNLWGCVVAVGCDNVNIYNNNAYQCISGWYHDQCNNVFTRNNMFDGRFKDDLGNLREQVVIRMCAFSGVVNAGTSDVTISLNKIIGANWGMEFVNNPFTSNVKGIVVSDNAINCAFCGISIGAADGFLAHGNTITSDYGFCNTGIEAIEGPNSSLTDNVISFNRPYAQENTGISIAGVGFKAINNDIRASVGIFDISYTGDVGLIKGNTISYGSVAIFLRNIVADIIENTAKLYIGGYVDSLGYSPQTCSPIYIDGSVDTSDSNVLISGNTLEASSTYASAINIMLCQFTHNTIIQTDISKFNPVFGIYGNGANQTGPGNFIYTHNVWQTPFYTFVQNAFVNSPPVSGTAVIGYNFSNNSNVNADSYSFSGAGGSGMTIVNPNLTTIDALDTSFDPDNKHAALTLSNGNLTATATSGIGSGAATRSTKSYLRGSRYCEFTAVAGTSGNVVVGLLNGTPNLFSGFALGYTNTGIGYCNDGTVYVNSVLLATISTWTTSDVVAMHFNPTMRKVWFRKNAGGWNNDTLANQNPDTGVGGYDVSAFGLPLFAGLTIYQNTAAITVNFGATAYALTPTSTSEDW